MGDEGVGAEGLGDEGFGKEVSGKGKAGDEGVGAEGSYLTDRYVWIVEPNRCKHLVAKHLV